MKRLVLAITAISLLAFGGLAVASPASAAPKWEVELGAVGWYNLGSTKKEARDQRCYASDFRKGSKVKVVNEKGQTVGIGSMKWKKSKPYRNNFGDYVVSCTLVAKFPVDQAKFYDITVDGLPAGSYSHKEMKKAGYYTLLQWR